MIKYNVFNEEFFNVAIKMAQMGQRKNQVPVGCVITRDNKLIAKAYNKRENGSAVAHAEILAIQKACRKIKDFRLENCDIYITLEPCPMCCGAIINARIKNCYFGAFDKKSGYAGSLENMFLDRRLNHAVNVEGGFKEKECGKLLTDFFKNKRKKNGC